jgi:hypothetical protein
LTLKDLKVEHPDKPSLAVRPGYYEYGDDGTFRRVGKRVSTEYGTGNDVQVRVWVLDHNRPLKVNKAYLLAIAATGWLGYWQCPDCDERIPHIVQHRNGHRYDTSPCNLEVVPDVDGRVWHRMTCIESMMLRPHESEEGYSNPPIPRRDANGFVDYCDDDEGETETVNPGFYYTTAKRETEIQNRLRKTETATTWQQLCDEQLRTTTHEDTY